MSMTPPEMTSEGTPPPRKKGMSGGAKLLIGLGVGLGILVLLCCGGVIATVYYVSTKVMSDQPQVIAEKTKEITQLEIPSGLQPRMSFDMTVPFFNRRLMLWTLYSDERTDSILVLFAMGNASAPRDQAEMQRLIDQALQQQHIPKPEAIKVKETHKKEVQIRNQTATFTISEGVGEKSGKPRIEVRGVFQGEPGPVMLWMNADAKKYPEKEIDKMLDSIK
jgi:hypothetical protein